MGMSEEQLRALQSASPEEALTMLTGLLGSTGATDAGAQTAYAQARGEFSARPVGPVMGPGGTMQGVNKEIIQTSATGKVLYANGVIYDPETKQTLYPPDQNLAADVPGADAWAAKVQDEWTTEQAEKWRQKLWDQGYQGAGLLQSESGGWGLDLVNALKEYHYNRYANFGKVQPITPQSAVGADITRESFDPLVLKEEVKGWGDVPFNKPLDGKTSEYFADRVIDLAMRLQKEHPEWTAEQIQTGASMRAQKEFVKTPGVKGAIRDAEEDEMDDTLRDSVVSLSQVGSIR